MSSTARKTWATPGGIHPPENKQQSLQTPIQTAAIPEELIVPLSQHIGAPAEAIVNIGDEVLKGQMIAQASGVVSVPVHAPSSGEIIAIEPRQIPHSSGMTAVCLIIKTDGKDEWIDHQGTQDYTQLDKATLITMIRESGIAGMGGAGFPTAVKLNTRTEQSIESLIINGTECEPYITADDSLMRERADQIIQGVLILQHIIQPNKETLIGVEDNKPEAIAALRKAAKDTQIEIVSFPTKYPSGGEKQLIQILTGKEVPTGGLPVDIGIVCQNIGTTAAIYRAIVHGEPLISRITTVTGYAVEKQQNYEVLLGTPIQHLLDASNYNKDNASRLIMGGPMMGFTLTSTAAPIIKASNCILAPTAAELPAPPPAQACIRCGMCAEVCPVSLLPQQMYWYAQAKDHEGLKAQHLMDCIECGACSYACPSTIPLVQYYRASKADIRQSELEHKKAEYSKERFEARQLRLEKAEAEKEAKRKARQAKAAQNAKETKASSLPDNASSTSSVPTNDPVATAIAAAKANNKETLSTDNSIQAAIDRAQAKRAGHHEDEDPKSKLQATISSLKKRITNAQAKIDELAPSDTQKSDALHAAINKLTEKLQKAQDELSQLEVN